MTPSATNISQFPELERLVQLVSSENPLQRKRLEAFLAGQNSTYFSFAENLSSRLNHSLLNTESDRLTAARAYNRTCMDMVRDQIRFRKTGKYETQDAQVALQTVYCQKDRMRTYIVGLLLSYLFWPNHYQMFQFYLRYLEEIQVGRCLEVGAGHGLFTAEMVRRFPDASVTLIDISAASIEVALEMLEAVAVDGSKLHCIHADFMTAPLPASSFDCIVMGEVLEHVNDALMFLEKARSFLRPEGSIFMSTCVNCPAPDHVYHFHTVDEIRDLVRSAGLRIEKEQALPAEAVAEDLWQKELITINYSAILKLAGTQ